MIQDHVLEQVIIDQRLGFEKRNTGTIRHIDFTAILQSQRIVVITGIRRSGKSTLLRQIAAHLDKYHYINFDDERLFGFALGDFQKLMLHFHKIGPSKTLLIDEIQNVPNWERFLRRVFDEGYKIIVTGSNAKLLSSELATHLTGRHKRIELFPFSFNEYLEYSNVGYQVLSSEITAQVLNSFDGYLQNGGFPEYAKNGDIEDLQNTYNDIIYKDLIVRFGIKNAKAFKTLAHFLYSNFTREISYNSLKSLTGISNANTIKDYIDYLEQSYLLFECYKYDFSLKQQTVYNKKIYAVDNGMRNAVSFRFSAELGQQLENLVYVELKRRYKDVYFYKTRDNYETDFIVPGAPHSLLQVSYTLKNPETEKREHRTLIQAMNELDVDESLIVTYNEEEIIDVSGKRILVIPAYKWLIQNN